MRKFLPYVFAAVAAVAVVIPARAADYPGKAGKWSISTQMDMPGMPFKMPPVTFQICLTEDDLKDPSKTVPSDQKKSSCKMGEYDIDGNTVTWTMDCPKEKMKVDGKVTFSDDHQSYTGSAKMTMPEQEITSKYTAKWLGACTK